MRRFVNKDFWVYTAMRISLGLVWLYAGLEKLLVEFGGKLATAGFLAHDFSTFGFLFRWMSGNPIVDGLVVFGEIAIGLALVLGLFTRFAGYMGALQSALFALATYPSNKDAVLAIFGSDTFYTLMMLLVATLTFRYNTYSLDYKFFLDEKFYRKHYTLWKVFTRWLT